MFEFDLDSFLRDKRISIPELSKKVSIPFQTLYLVKNRKKIAPKILRNLEHVFGDCSNYLYKDEKQLLEK